MATIKYKVKEGDWISKIANNYGVDWNAITGYSSGDVNKIYPGEVLTIDTGGSNNNNGVSSSGLPNNINGSDLTDVKKIDLLTNPEREYNRYSAVGGDLNPLTDLLKLDELYKTTNDSITGLGKSIADYYKTSDYQDTSNSIADSQKELAEIKAQLGALETERKSIPLNVERDADGKVVTDAGLDTTSSRRLRDNAIEALKLQAEQQALSGNIEASKILFKQQQDIELTPLLKELEYKKENVNRIKDVYSKLDSRLGKYMTNQAKQEELAIKEAYKSIEKKQREKSDIQDIYLAAAKNGLPYSVRNKILNAQSVDEALLIAAPYLKKKTSDGSGGAVNYNNTGSIFSQYKTG